MAYKWKNQEELLEYINGGADIKIAAQGALQFGLWPYDPDGVALDIKDPTALGRTDATDDNSGFWTLGNIPATLVA